MQTQSIPLQRPTYRPALRFSQSGYCKPYGRLNVVIDQDDEMGTFIFRTTGFNSTRTLAARLHYYHAVSGGLLACIPLELKLWGDYQANYLVGFETFDEIRNRCVKLEIRLLNFYIGLFNKLSPFLCFIMH